MSQVPPAMPAGDVTDNDKLMALLAYLLMPIVSIIILLVDTMKARPYQKYHALNSLGLAVAETLVAIIACICIFVVSIPTAGLASCLTPVIFVVFIPGIYYAIVSYAKPSYFEIPVVTQFMKKQGWLTV